MIKALNLHLTKNGSKTRTFPAKRRSMATLIKAVLYLEMDRFALFFCESTESYFIQIVSKMSTEFLRL